MVLGNKGFHGIGGLAAMVSTTIQTIPDSYLLPYIDSIFEEGETIIYLLR